MNLELTLLLNATGPSALGLSRLLKNIPASSIECHSNININIVFSTTLDTQDNDLQVLISSELPRYVQYHSTPHQLTAHSYLPTRR